MTTSSSRVMMVSSPPAGATVSVPPAAAMNDGRRGRRRGTVRGLGRTEGETKTREGLMDGGRTVDLMQPPSITIVLRLRGRITIDGEREGGRSERDRE
ncbi:PhoX family phosphatase [Sesbania bispinosa]|nr:PhoX family phosphatase [Sesbania bispinosa]